MTAPPRSAPATLSSGVATLTKTFATAGTQVLTATYAGSTAYAASTSSALSLIVGSSTAACSVSLEGEEGPYFVDDSASGYFRTNILSNLDGTSTQAGVALALTLYVYDAKNSCTAMQGVQVDIWSCNAAGVYSAESSESTTGQSWLRGYQLTDANGMVAFQTIIPGWYSGRTNHIHLRFRSTYDQTTTSGSNTMQLFFDQTPGQLARHLHRTLLDRRHQPHHQHQRPRQLHRGRRDNLADLDRQHDRRLRGHVQGLHADLGGWYKSRAVSNDLPRGKRRLLSLVVAALIFLAPKGAAVHKSKRSWGCAVKSSLDFRKVLVQGSSSIEETTTTAIRKARRFCSRRESDLPSGECRRPPPRRIATACHS